MNLLHETVIQYAKRNRHLKLAAWIQSGSYQAITDVAGTTYSGKLRELRSMMIDAADPAIKSTAKYVRISAYGLGPNSRVWLTDE